MRRSLPPAEGPRERLARDGAAHLATAELLALVLRGGTAEVPARAIAEQLVCRFDTLEGLAAAGDAELSGVPGIGPAMIASLRAAFEVGSRLVRAPLAAGCKLESPEQVFGHFGPRLRHARQESFFVLLLDSRQRLLRDLEVSRGSLNQSLVHPREVFAPALRESAAAILVLHNHPSGDPRPSQDDLEVTRRLAEAGAILGIRLLDHIVIGAEGFESLSRAGWSGAQVSGSKDP